MTLGLIAHSTETPATTAVTIGVRSEDGDKPLVERRVMIGVDSDDPAAVGAGILLLTTQPGQERVVEAAIAAANRSDKPLLFVQGAGNHGEIARRMLREAGHGYFDGTHDALAVAQVFAERSTPEPATDAQALDLPTNLPAGFQTEPAARRLLEAAGIPTTRWLEAKDATAAVQAARSYVRQALAAGAKVRTGQGVGPLNHGFAPLPTRLGAL